MGAGFNWRRGLGPSLLLIAATVGYAAWIGRANSGAQAIRFWAIVAVFVLGELVLALATSYLAQNGREGLSRLLRGGVTIAFLGGVLWFGNRVSSTVFTNEERVAFVAVDRNGERRLLHPALGFSILHPGPGFVPSGSQAYRANAHFYAFTDQQAGEALTVGLFKGFGGSSASLRDLIEEMGKQAGALAGKTGASVRVVRLDAPEADPPRAELDAIIGEGRHYRMSGYGWKRPGQSPIAVILAVMSPEADAHSDVLASFQP
jgi:hypothetical protein